MAKWFKDFEEGLDNLTELCLGESVMTTNR